jgi:hypothetical protein
MASTFKYLTVHCAATQPLASLGVEDIRKMHKARGWSDVGYHEVIKTDGTRQLGRPLSRTGAHVANHNTGNLGICMIGGIDAKGKAVNNFTKEQFAALRQAITEYAGLYGIKEENIKGHRDWSPDINGDGKITSVDWIKQCPCFDVKDLLKSWK